MRVNRENMERNFVCPKCRRHGAVTEEVTVGRCMARMIPLPSTRYLAVTCGLCGYTEFYQMAILEKMAEKTPASARLAEKPE